MSLRAAINSKCRDCAHDPAAPGTWRAQVAVCSCPSCPLWPFRPAPAGVTVPRDPATVSRDWLRMGHAEAIAALRSDTPITPEFEAESAHSSTEGALPASEVGGAST
jgi:hypothetical protein